ncbi:unknown [Prevotella sp. CAG:255]|nr:unknown [Prevotella sp. CAG:255]
MLFTFKTIGLAQKNHNIPAIGEYIYCNRTA